MHKEYEHGIAVAKRFWERDEVVIRGDAELIDAVGHLFRLRKAINSRGEVGLAAVESRATAVMHRCILQAGPDMYLAQVFCEHKLSKIEKEILLALLTDSLGVRPIPGSMVGLCEVMRQGAGSSLKMRRAFGARGRLVLSGLIETESSRGEVCGRVAVSNDLLNKLVHKEQRRKSKWDVKDYNSCLDLIRELIKVATEKADMVEGMQAVGAFEEEDLPQTRAIQLFLRNMRNVALQNRKWPISQLMSQASLSQGEKAAVLVLLGRELGFGRRSSELTTGQGLASVMCHSAGDFRRCLDMLKSDGRLVRDGYIQVCGGEGDGVAQEDEWTLRSCTFELTDDCLEKLKVNRRRKSGGAARPAKVNMEQLVLSEKVRRALAMCAAQAKHSKVLLEDWGLGERFSYGSSVAMLFSGPPGTGKTACAEALAGELGKPIMVMNYAELQNCWVGQTEKNVVKAFREAGRQDAVLFWDEADAIFGDRDKAHQNWEVREVNVLLQELERFKGVCILATNRKLSLDKALERRIAMKVEFERPAGPERLEIWRRMLPKKMPLGKDVDIEQLAEEDLSGGQIKNVIMNAARMAIANGPESRVTQAEFARALAMETNGGWSEARGGFGFGKKTA